MKKIKEKNILNLIVLVLMLSILLLSACKAESPNDRKYSYIPLNNMVVAVGKANGVSDRDNYELSYTRMSITIPKNEKLAAEINQALTDWLGNALTICDELWLKMNAEYENDRYFKVGCYATFNDNGLFSAVCRLDYSEYGDDHSYILNSAVWIVETDEKLGSEQILNMSTIDFRNWLSINFSPCITEYTDKYPNFLTESSENYIEYIDFALNDDGATFYLSYDGMYYPSDYLEVNLSFSENPSLFAYDLEIKTDIY